MKNKIFGILKGMNLPLISLDAERETARELTYVSETVDGNTQHFIRFVSNGGSVYIYPYDGTAASPYRINPQTRKPITRNWMEYFNTTGKFPTPDQLYVGDIMTPQAHRSWAMYGWAQTDNADEAEANIATMAESGTAVIITSVTTVGATEGMAYVNGRTMSSPSFSVRFMHPLTLQLQMPRVSELHPLTTKELVPKYTYTMAGPYTHNITKVVASFYIHPTGKGRWPGRFAGYSPFDGISERIPPRDQRLWDEWTLAPGARPHPRDPRATT